MRGLSNVVGSVIALAAIVAVTAAIAHYISSMSTSSSKLIDLSSRRLVEQVILYQDTMVYGNSSYVCISDNYGIVNKLVLNLGDKLVSYGNCVPKTMLGTAKEAYIVTKHGAVYPLTSNILEKLVNMEGSAPLNSLLTEYNTSEQSYIVLNTLATLNPISELALQQGSGDYLKISVNYMYITITTPDGRTYALTATSNSGLYDLVINVKRNVVCLGGGAVGNVVSCYRKLTFNGTIEVYATLVSREFYERFLRRVISATHPGDFTVYLGVDGGLIYVNNFGTYRSSYSARDKMLHEIVSGNTIILSEPWLDAYQYTYSTNGIYYTTTYYVAWISRYSTSITPYPILTAAYKPLAILVSSVGYPTSVALRYTYVTSGGSYQYAIATPYFISFVKLEYGTCKIQLLDAQVEPVQLTSGVLEVRNLVCILESLHNVTVTLASYAKPKTVRVPAAIVRCYYPAVLMCNGSITVLYSFNWWIFDNRIISRYTDLERAFGMPYPTSTVYSTLVIMSPDGDKIVDETGEQIYNILYNIYSSSNSQYCTPIILREPPLPPIGEPINCYTALPGVTSIYITPIAVLNLRGTFYLPLPSEAPVPGIRQLS